MTTTTTRKRSSAATSTAAEATPATLTVDPIKTEPINPALAATVEPVHTPVGFAAFCAALPRANLGAQKQLNNSQVLFSDRWVRSLNTGFNASNLWQRSLEASTWSEFLDMQVAVGKRLQQQQENWFTGLAGLVEEFGELKRANTMSKIIEQQCNLMAQFGLLMQNQTTNLLELQDNIEISYGYWASEKLKS